MNECWSVDLGRMPYAEAFALQRGLLEEVAEGRMPDLLLRVEHPPVYTLGANFHDENLPLPLGDYAKLGIEIERTDRGGDITYHGPGQLVVYPIFDLKRYGKDLHRWIRDLEEAVMRACGDFGLESRRFAPHTGVWIEDRKICAIGIKVRRWTSMHGIALNCENDLGPFQWIVPCGIRGFGVTSLSRETGRQVTPSDAFVRVATAFEEIFELELEVKSACDVLDHLPRPVTDARRHDASPDPAAFS